MDSYDDEKRQTAVQEWQDEEDVRRGKDGREEDSDDGRDLSFDDEVSSGDQSRCGSPMLMLEMQCSGKI